MNRKVPGNKRQFIKRLYSYGIPRNIVNKYLDLMKKYKGRLPYFRMYLLIFTALKLGKSGEEILCYIDVVMSSETPKKA